MDSLDVTSGEVKNIWNNESYNSRIENTRDPITTVTIRICDEDAAFILGKSGRTKVKIARVSNARIELRDIERSHDDVIGEIGASRSRSYLELIITGSAEETERAQLYVRLIMKQRIGPVQIDFDPHRDDLTVLRIPHEAVGYVTGAQGCVLRKIEDEWGTLMFFVGGQSTQSGRSSKHIDTGQSCDGQKLEQLLIFGPMRSRRGTELKIMSAVEQKCPTFFTARVNEIVSDEEGFSTDIMFINADDFSYALGKEGRTRKKLARASGCLLEYVGKVAFMSGTLSERRRAREYLTWLIQQRTSSVTIDTRSRDDVTVLNIPTELVPSITGRYGTGLRILEQRTGTFCFFEGGENKEEEKQRQERSRRGAEYERLFVFGVGSAARNEVRHYVEKLLDSTRRRINGNSKSAGVRDSNTPLFVKRRSYRSRSPCRLSGSTRYSRGVTQSSNRICNPVHPYRPSSPMSNRPIVYNRVYETSPLATKSQYTDPFVQSGVYSRFRADNRSQGVDSYSNREVNRTFPRSHGRDHSLHGRNRGVVESRYPPSRYGTHPDRSNGTYIRRGRRGSSDSRNLPGSPANRNYI